MATNPPRMQNLHVGPANQQIARNLPFGIDRFLQQDQLQPLGLTASTEAQPQRLAASTYVQPQKNPLNLRVASVPAVRDFPPPPGHNAFYFSDYIQAHDAKNPHQNRPNVGTPAAAAPLDLTAAPLNLTTPSKDEAHLIWMHNNNKEHCQATCQMGFPPTIPCNPANQKYLYECLYPWVNE